MPYKTLPDISEKQQKIIELVYKFRFINRIQLQTLFGHKDARRINAWLKDLVDKNYLGRIYSHKLLENTKPAIYYLANNGITYVQWSSDLHFGNEMLEAKYVKKFYEDKKASDTFRKHCVFLCEIYLQLKEVEKSIEWEYEFYTKTELFSLMRFDKDLSEKRQYMPDVNIYKVKKSGEDSISFMLELFDPHVPRFALRYKVNQYFKLHDEEDWSDYDSINQKFPKILFILPNQQKLNRLASFIQEKMDGSYDVGDLVFMLTTYEKVMEDGVGNNNIWKIVKEK